MKSKIFTLVFLALISVFSGYAQSSSNKVNPVGSWKFEAPYAPAGYTTGTIDVVFAENKYAVSLMFTGSGSKIPAEKVKYENDTLKFNMYVEGQDIAVTLKPDEAAKLVGKAVYSDGEIPLTLTKDQPKK